MLQVTRNQKGLPAHLACLPPLTQMTRHSVNQDRQSDVEIMAIACMQALNTVEVLPARPLAQRSVLPSVLKAQRATTL